LQSTAAAHDEEKYYGNETKGHFCPYAGMPLFVQKLEICNQNIFHGAVHEYDEHLTKNGCTKMDKNYQPILIYKMK